jgi:Acyl-CoA dehydrogenase, C-terminal domain
VQRLLDTQRAWVDAGRVLAYRTALELDVAKHHPDAARRQQASRWCALVTPVLKASWTDQGFHGSSDCLQVFGGHGYVREWGIEQIVRDARIAMIYEGTNEIQAQDLLFRKVLPDQGTALSGLLDEMSADIASMQGAAADRAREGIARLRMLLDTVRSAGSAASERLYPVAGDFLRSTTLVLMAWAWTRLEAAAQPGNGASAYARWVWPELAMRTGMVCEALQA